jgi:hypothetical protein
MTEISKKILVEAKHLNIENPKQALVHFIKEGVDVSDPRGNKSYGDYLITIVNDVACSICLKGTSYINTVKCKSCKDTKTEVVFEPCSWCLGTGEVGVGDLSFDCKQCSGIGEFKILIPCQECKTEIINDI